MLSKAAGISGLMSKPPGGFDISPEIPAAPDSMAIFRTLCGFASEQSVLISGLEAELADGFETFGEVHEADD